MGDAQSHDEKAEGIPHSPKRNPKSLRGKVQKLGYSTVEDLNLGSSHSKLMRQQAKQQPQRCVSMPAGGTCDDEDDRNVAAAAEQSARFPEDDGKKQCASQQADGARGGDEIGKGTDGGIDAKKSMKDGVKVTRQPEGEITKAMQQPVAAAPHQHGTDVPTGGSKGKVDKKATAAGAAAAALAPTGVMSKSAAIAGETAGTDVLAGDDHQPSKRHVPLSEGSSVPQQIKQELEKPCESVQDDVKSRGAEKSDTLPLKPPTSKSSLPKKNPKAATSSAKAATSSAKAKQAENANATGLPPPPIEQGTKDSSSDHQKADHQSSCANPNAITKEVKPQYDGKYLQESLCIEEDAENYPQQEPLPLQIEEEVDLSEFTRPTHVPLQHLHLAQQRREISAIESELVEAGLSPETLTGEGQFDQVKNSSRCRDDVVIREDVEQLHDAASGLPAAVPAHVVPPHGPTEIHRDPHHSYDDAHGLPTAVPTHVVPPPGPSYSHHRDPHHHPSHDEEDHFPEEMGADVAQVLKAINEVAKSDGLQPKQRQSDKYNAEHKPLNKPTPAALPAAPRVEQTRQPCDGTLPNAVPAAPRASSRKTYHDLDDEGFPEAAFDKDVEQVLKALNAANGDADSTAPPANGPQDLQKGGTVGDKVYTSHICMKEIATYGCCVVSVQACHNSNTK